MFKLGFIDYYLDEWHANNYPAWIREASGGEVEVAYAYGKTDSPLGGLSTAAWCEKFGIDRCAGIEELVEKSDGLIVLSPDNCEMHEVLCQVPLRSGKPTYVDKTFAPDYPTARRIFALAEESGTPCYSTSALRFAEEYRAIPLQDITGFSFWGPNDFETYAIHQLEPLMMLAAVPASRVMYLPGEDWYTLCVELADGRCGTITGFGTGAPFTAHIAARSGSIHAEVTSDFFRNFVAELVDFFRTGDVKVSHMETLSIMAVRGAGIEAQANPGLWVPVPQI